MTIKEVLEADWNVDRIDITVRNEETTRYIMQYVIGRDVEPGRSKRYLYEAEIGDVYQNSGMNTLYIRRIIQHRQLENLSPAKSGLRGVLIQEIPAELLGLTVSYMVPYHCGWSNELHGYRFECYVDQWNGIKGENKQMTLDLEEDDGK